MTDSGLESLPPLRDVIARHGLWADKKLGQNFLLDGNVTDKIARAAGDLSQTDVYEIGPGPGGLTRSLLRAGAKSVTAIEFDARAVQALQDLREAANGRLHIVAGDALHIDLASLGDGPGAIVANLPYNIATPLLVRWLRRIHESNGACFSSMTLMFQREVADRITAPVGVKAYGRLAVLAQWQCTVRRVFDIPGSAFVPPPKVTSSVVHFIPRGDADRSFPFAAMESLTAAAFGQRRKMLRSSLKEYGPALAAACIAESLRAEQLPVSDYVRLAAAKPIRLDPLQASD